MGTAGARREKIRPMRACLIKAALPSPFTCPWGSTVSIQSISLITYPTSFLSTWVIFPRSSCCDGNLSCPHVSCGLDLNRAFLQPCSQPQTASKGLSSTSCHPQTPSEIVTSFSYSNTTDSSHSHAMSYTGVAILGLMR